MENVTAFFKCTGCQEHVQTKMPSIRWWNFEQSSGVVLVHDRPTMCLECRRLYLPVITGVETATMEIKIEWKEVKIQKPKKPELPLDMEEVMMPVKPQ